MHKRICALLLLGLLAGCATWTVQPPTGNEKLAEGVTVTVTPFKNGNNQIFGFVGFALQVDNRTEKEITIDWNRTMFLLNGQTSGGFMYEGVVYADRNNPKQPDIVLPNSTFTKMIWPNNLVDFSGGKYGSGWYHKEMPEGKNGVYLTVQIGDVVVNKIVTFVVGKSTK